MKHIVYKTTNLINGRWYIGVHKLSYRPETYYGSGDLILAAIEKYGKSNFSRETLHTYNTPEEAYTREAELVTDEVVNDRVSYNIRLGGEGGWERHGNTNKIIVRDKDGNRLKVDREDPRYLSGELVPYNKGIPQLDSVNEKRRISALKIDRSGPKPTYTCSKCNQTLALISKKRHDNGLNSCIRLNAPRGPVEL